MAKCPVVATFHASGELGWARMSIPVWGFLLDRIDARIAVSEQASASASRYSPADYEVIPNGVLIPPEADPAGRENPVPSWGARRPAKACRSCSAPGRRSAAGPAPHSG